MFRALYPHPRIGLRGGFMHAPGLREINQMLGSLLSNPSMFPSLRLGETKDGFILDANLPGVTADDIKITVQGKTIYLEGTRKQPTLEEGSRYHRQERNFGVFSRAITLPAEVDVGKVTASQDNGILHIVLPKDQAVLAREIKVS